MASASAGLSTAAHPSLIQPSSSGKSSSTGAPQAASTAPRLIGQPSFTAVSPSSSSLSQQSSPSWILLTTGKPGIPGVGGQPSSTQVSPSVSTPSGTWQPGPSPKANSGPQLKASGGTTGSGGIVS